MTSKSLTLLGTGLTFWNNHSTVLFWYSWLPDKSAKPPVAVLQFASLDKHSSGTVYGAACQQLKKNVALVKTVLKRKKNTKGTSFLAGTGPTPSKENLYTMKSLKSYQPSKTSLNVSYVCRHLFSKGSQRCISCESALNTKGQQRGCYNVVVRQLAATNSKIF